MPCIARRDGRFFPCDPVCSRFWYDKQDIWTKGFSTESPSQREDETKDVQAVVRLGFSVRHFCLCVCWTCWSWFYCNYFFFFFLVCVFSAGFKGKAPKRSTKSKEPGQEGGCLLCKHFGQWLGIRQKFQYGRRRERRERRFGLFLAKSYIQLTLKFPSPKDYY